MDDTLKVVRTSAQEFDQHQIFSPETLYSNLEDEFILNQFSGTTSVGLGLQKLGYTVMFLEITPFDKSVRSFMLGIYGLEPSGIPPRPFQSKPPFPPVRCIALLITLVRGMCTSRPSWWKEL